MWPARWWTGTSGFSIEAASDLANCRPTSSEPTSPGPCVTATASMDWLREEIPASASALSTTPQMSRRCWREASSGTTPPHSRWIATWDATTLERICHGRAGSSVSATTAAAVSSHELSIPRINIIGTNAVNRN